MNNEKIFFQKVKDIINTCEHLLNDTEYKTPNTFVIQVILREFKDIQDFYACNKKVLLLSKQHWTLWSIRTIIDSADYDYDEELFDKVREFAQFCKTLSENMVVYKYSN
ncbi:MAG: hypothetical protein IJW83_02100 [Clostridia bacterium]|nr:hypothetical protein [Clostridia bacterium]